MLAGMAFRPGNKSYVRVSLRYLNPSMFYNTERGLRCTGVKLTASGQESRGGCVFMHTHVWKSLCKV